MCGDPTERLNIPLEEQVCICPALLPSDPVPPLRGLHREKDAKEEEKRRMLSSRFTPEGRQSSVSASEFTSRQCLIGPGVKEENKSQNSPRGGKEDGEWW